MARTALVYVLSILVVAGAASRAAAEKPAAQVSDAGPVAAPPAPVSPAAVEPASTSSFGARRQFVLSSDLALDFGYNSIDSKSRVVVNLAADYFLVQNGSVGIVAGYRRGDTTTTAADEYRIGVRAGYHVALGPRLGLWPRLGVELRSASTQLAVNSSSTASGLALAAFVPVLIYPASGFFVGFGPYLSQDLWASQTGGGSEKQLDLGARFVLGGFF